MRFDEENDVYRFETTDREALAHDGVIGLSPTLEVYQGYDGSLLTHDGELTGPWPLTPQERVELAAHMIERWTRFLRANGDPGITSPSST